MELELGLTSGAEISIGSKGPHHLGHAANCKVLPQQPHHLLMDGQGNGLHPLDKASQRIGALRDVAPSPQELLEIKRPHSKLPLVPNRKRGSIRKLPEPHAEQRARADHINAPVLREVFEGGSCSRAFLQLIKEDERFAGNELRAGNKQRYAGKDALCRERAVEDACHLGVLDEVDLYEALVLAAPELPDDKGLADLASTVDEQALSAVRVLPLSEDVEHLALEHEASLYEDAWFSDPC